MRTIAWRVYRALLALSIVGVLATSAIEAVHAQGNCKVGGGCNCCLVVDCDGRHWAKCPTDHHDCKHHEETECEGWDNVD
jgi:hypothetical protein